MTTKHPLCWRGIIKQQVGLLVLSPLGTQTTAQKETVFTTALSDYLEKEQTLHGL